MFEVLCRDILQFGATAQSQPPPSTKPAGRVQDDTVVDSSNTLNQTGTPNDEPEPTSDDNTDSQSTPGPVRLFRVLPASMRDPPFRDPDPPKSMDDPRIVAGALTSPLAGEYLVLKLWDIGAEAVVKVVHTLAELKNDTQTTALKEYYTDITAAVNKADKAVKTFAGTKLSAYDIFISKLQTLTTFRNDQHDDNSFVSRWKMITEQNVKRENLQAALDSVSSYRTQAKEVSDFIKNCSAMVAAGLSDGQSDISSGDGDETSAASALKRVFEEDNSVPSAITVV